MKKLILILAIATLSSCEKDEQDCKCDMKVYISDGNTTQQYFITGVESDCNGRVIEDLDLPNGHFPTYECE